jgi:RNA polymerase sigma-70 factor (ECF subfamily)
VRPWLYTVATNQAIDLQRRNHRHTSLSLDRQKQGNSRVDGSECDTLGSTVPAPSDGGGPSDAAIATENAEKVRRAVDCLPDAQRQVLLLVYYQGLKYREAADVLSIPVGTVKSRLHAAIQGLNDRLRSAA